MTIPADATLSRLERDATIVALVLAVVAVILWPGQPSRAAGVLGGFGLMALSYRGIRAGVDAVWATSPEAPDGDDPTSRNRPPRAGRGFVKFFTRHAMLALGAYVMMARFEFDPVAMLAGVTAPAVAAAVEIVRTVRARSRGPLSRSS